METTVKRISLALTAGDLQQLDDLCDHFQEHQTNIIKRGLIILHYATFSPIDDKLVKRIKANISKIKKELKKNG